MHPHDAVEFLVAERNIRAVVPADGIESAGRLEGPPARFECLFSSERHDACHVIDADLEFARTVT
jgi:hypothetical protein